MKDGKQKIESLNYLKLIIKAEINCRIPLLYSIHPGALASGRIIPIIFSFPYKHVVALRYIPVKILKYHNDKQMAECVHVWDK